MIRTTEFFDYGLRTITINQWEPEDGENCVCPACERELFITSDGDIIAYTGKNGVSYCDLSCEERDCGEECKCCGETRYLTEQSFCADCVTICQYGRCRSFLGNYANPSQTAYYGVMTDGDQIMPVCMDCAREVTL